MDKYFRRMRNKPEFLKDNGHVSSALFKDEHGVSVDVDDKRELDEIINHEESLHNEYIALHNKENNDAYKLKAIVQVNEEDCNNASVVIKRDPVIEPINNPYHTLLIRSESQFKLTDSQARKLALSSIVVKKY